ncbi:hypothetical protein [Candidatus Nitrososphaera sp. FF02]|uniref:hypothetical protein n=1 Tax=Candidatus Nitrososphaera sp. FF02 TaxID=3398226 RepID=UPI0039E8E7B5
MAAAYLVKARDNYQRFQRFEAIAIPPHWRNVALFFAGQIGRLYQGEAAQILEVCRDINRKEPGNLTKQGSWLALDIAADCSFGFLRMLQRSAIELAFTLLDEDLDAEELSEFTSKVRQLPAEDRRDHVIPLLESRIADRHLPSGYVLLDMLHWIEGDRATIEKEIEISLNDKLVKPSELLSKSLFYRLSSEFITSRFGEIVKGFTDGEFIEAFHNRFRTDPDYAADILRKLELAQSMIPSLLNVALDKPIATRSTSFDLRSMMELRTVSMSQVDQAVMAVKIRTFLGKSSPVFRELLNSTARTELSELFQSAFSNNSISLEIKVLLFGVLSRLIYQDRTDTTDDYIRIYRRFQDELKGLQLEKRKSIDRLLYKISALSHECKVVSRKKLARPSGIDSELWSRLNVYAHICDTLSSKEFISICYKVENVSNINTELELIKQRSRIGGVTVYHREHKPRLPASFVSLIIAKGARILLRPSSEHWKVPPLVRRLNSYEWVAGTDEHRGKLEKSLENLYRAMKHASDKDESRNEIPVLLANVLPLQIRIKLIDHFLTLYGETPDEILDAARLRSARPIQDTRIMNLYQIVSRLDQKAIVGILKLHALQLRFTEMYHASPHMEVSIPQLKCDNKVLIENLKKDSFLIKEACVALLSEFNLSDSDAKEVLRYYKEGFKQIWVSFIRKIVERSESFHALTFLKSVLSDNQYHPSVKSACTIQYIKIYDKENGFQKLESKLGLPFQ